MVKIEVEEDDYVAAADLRMLLNAIIRDFGRQEVLKLLRGVLLQAYREAGKRELDRFGSLR